MAKVGRGPLSIGRWTVFPDLNRIESDGAAQMLQPRSMDVLLYLADRPGEVVSSDELLDGVWLGRLSTDDAVHRRIADLRRVLHDDARHPEYIQTVPKRGYRLIAGVCLAPAGPGPVVLPDVVTAPGAWPRVRAGVFALSIASLALAMAFGLVLLRDGRARSQAVERAQLLLQDDLHQEAFTALQPWMDEPDDPRLALLLQAITLPATVRTDPAGVPVAYRPSGVPSAPWVLLGTSPVEGARLPRGHYQLRLGDQVVMSTTHPGVTLNSAGVAERVVVLPTEPVPAEMTFVPGGRYRFGAWGFLAEQDLGGYLIDRLEVSNAEYLRFVETGGYGNAEYWQALVGAPGGSLSWEMIAEEFVDRTGAPGPAGWELGSYLPGTGALPVTGVSWYEAQAFLVSRGKSLPSAQHWLRAALGPMEWKFPYAAAVVPHSNLDGAALAPPGSVPANAVHGAFDLIGNAREWTASRAGLQAVAMGGSYREPVWSYNFPAGVDPLLRSDDLGFRGMRRTAQSLPDPADQIELFNDFSAPIRRVNDEVFEGMAYQYAYQPGMLRADRVTVVDETAHEHWVLRRVLIPTEREDDPLPVSIYLPRVSIGPLQSVVYLPPADSWSPGFRTDSIDLASYQIDFVPRSGRALIWPVLSGSHERYDGIHAVSGVERAAVAIERSRRIRNELGRLLDYLADEPGFDGSRVALMGLSHGAQAAAQVLAVEPRFRAAVLYSVGIAPPNPVFSNSQNDPNLFWARVRQPVLIVNGRYDPIRPHHYILESLLGLLATPPADKKAVLLEAAHWPLPRNQMTRVSLEWLDRYLDPIPATSAAVEAERR